MTTKLTLSRRREEVLEQLLNFRGHTYIQDYIQNKYDVGKKAVEKDITNAYLTITKEYPIDTQTIVSTHIALYYSLANDAKEGFDPKGAASILEKIERLLKLHQPDTQINVQNNILNVESLTLEQIEKLLNESK
jgi:hypothetical protein